MRAHVDSTRRPEVVGGLGGFGGAFAIPDGLSRAAARRLDRRRRHQDGDRHRGRPLRHDRHRPRRDVRRRRRLHRRRAARVPRLRGRRTSRPGRRRRAGRQRRRRLSRGRRGAGRRRDGRAPGADGGRRVRPRGLLHRRGRALAGHRRLGGPCRGRHPRAARRRACTPTASRWCARWSPSGTSTSASPTRRGCAGRSATRHRRPARGRHRTRRWPRSARSC